jgi:predicted transcriptional regulator of viral defense system
MSAASMARDFRTFVSSLLAISAEANEERPVVRVWTRNRLFQLFDQALQANNIPLKRYTKTRLVDALVESGILDRIESSLPPDKRTPQFLYYLSYAGSHEPDPPSSAEILLALKPRGVVCYSTAVFLHGLSTQIPNHHHVAGPTPTMRGNVRTTDNESASGDESGKDRSKLGQQLFELSGSGFYAHRRSDRHLQEHELVQNDPKTMVRITTLEQTLYDTLFHPRLCGGAAIVFEAWESAESRYNEDRLFSLMKASSYHPIIRRIGAMLECIPGAGSSSLLESISILYSGLEQQHEPIELIPGAGCTDLLPKWQVLVP